MALGNQSQRGAAYEVDGVGVAAADVDAVGCATVEFDGVQGACGSSDTGCLGQGVPSSTFIELFVLCSRCTGGVARLGVVRLRGAAVIGALVNGTPIVVAPATGIHCGHTESSMWASVSNSFRV